MSTVTYQPKAPPRVNARTACEMLGIYHKQLRKLVESGHVVEHRLPVGRARYDLGSIQRLLAGQSGPRGAA